MLPKLKISSFLLKRLERVKQQCSGCLFGVFYGEGTLLLVGLNLESSIGSLNYEQIQHKFPAEIDLCGLVKFGDCTDAEAHLSDIIKDVDITDNPILLHCELATLVGLSASIFMHGKLQEIAYEVMEAEELFRDFCFTRVKCSLEIYTEETAQAVQKNMHALRKTVSGGSLAFCVVPSKVYITNTGTHGNSGVSSKTQQSITNESILTDLIKVVGECIKESRENKENTQVARKKANIPDTKLSAEFGALGCDYDVLNLDVLSCRTRSYSAAESKTTAPPSVSAAFRCEEQKTCIPLEVEAMAMLGKGIKLNRLYDILIESICRSLRLFECSMLEHLEENEANKIMMPRSYHFFPQEFGHFISCSYLDGVADDDANMQEKRKRVHRQFGLPVTRPYFRCTNRCIFHCDVTPNMPLVNPHRNVRPSGLSDSKQYVVHGNYYYYHYLQQQMQDNGWGCAYRSLQTICSWFLLQGYTARSVPTHREIQQYLVKIGDKPSNFAGSSQWIGSTEVSMCLQGFLNVDSKIIHIASGSELAIIASELVSHFQVQGTPIMIGGGVLAHTIIGVDYSAQLGQVKYLILDPHYTGTDDIQTILAKGWCGWKPVEFWDKKSYYNLCLPQRPIMF